MSTNEKQSLIGLEYIGDQYAGSFSVEETETEIVLHVKTFAEDWFLRPRLLREGLLICRSPVYHLFPVVFDSVESFKEACCARGDGIPNLHRAGPVWRDHNGETCLEPV